MADFEQWFVLPVGTMPTVRQVLECGGGLWLFLRCGIRVFISIDAEGSPCYRTKEDGEAYNEAPFAEIMGVHNPKPINAPMPTPEQVGEASRWVVLSLSGRLDSDKVCRERCTLRTVDKQIEALFDGDNEWTCLASQWGDGMVAIRDSATSGG